MEACKSDTHQVFVKLLDGKHKILNFSTPSISVSALKRRIQTLTSIPSDLHLLLSNDSRVLHDDQTLNIARSRVNLRLRGGKGGFGSLLRGAATKAGQKKTNNFDACRDMSGRRLRHVNAEKKLEEWRAEAEERKLEKMAEEYIKKKTKELVKSGKINGGDGTEKYVAKYREDSARCMEEIERSVRESVMGLGSSKRKDGVQGSESDSKRLKIWYGKRKLGESDSEDDSDEENKGEDQKSVIIDAGSLSDSSKETDQSSGSVTGGKIIDAGTLDQVSEEEGTAGVESLKQDNNLGESQSAKLEEINSQLPGVSCSEEKAPCAVEASNSTVLEPVQEEEAVSVSVQVLDLDKPLNFDEYHSAAEVEVCC
ncbi:protein sde2 homolog [Phtheirospermum japonicum]|uniref:Protein sde2 homolog n=1 Tax=Phtheirospermum japonicum TaxID=374723 RepID=A0A830CGU5_9LAMI|nr:protein sde2 homolog [Phtheirospermum japonicum]